MPMPMMATGCDVDDVLLIVILWDADTLSCVKVLDAWTTVQRQCNVSACNSKLRRL